MVEFNQQTSGNHSTSELKHIIGSALGKWNLDLRKNDEEISFLETNFDLIHVGELGNYSITILLDIDGYKSVTLHYNVTNKLERVTKNGQEIQISYDDMVDLSRLFGSR